MLPTSLPEVRDPFPIPNNPLEQCVVCYDTGPPADEPIITNPKGLLPPPLLSQRGLLPKISLSNPFRNIFYPAGTHAGRSWETNNHIRICHLPPQCRSSDWRQNHIRCPKIVPSQQRYKVVMELSHLL